MTTKTKRIPHGPQLNYESGGWITGRLLEWKLTGDPFDLLARSADPRPGNLRYAIDGQQMYLLGELRDADGLMTLPDAAERLFAAAGHPAVAVSRAEMACVLGESGDHWSHAQDQPDRWQAVLNDPQGCRHELAAVLVAGGAEICSRLADWEADLGAASQRAIACLLAAAHGRVRFARFQLRQREARAVSFAAGDRLDIELPDSVSAVVAACRLVRREVRALTDEALARTYLETVTRVV